VRLEDGRLRLIDFEGACELGVDGPVNLYTPGYASPERHSRPEVTAEADLYALGSVMLALMMPIGVLSGLKPTALREFSRAIGRDLGVPSAMIGVIEALTQADPERRPTATAARRKLEGIRLERSHREPRIADSTVSDAQLESVIEGALEFTESVADVTRTDRLFPGAIGLNNPLSLDHGALGVAHAFMRIRGDVPASFLDWMLESDLSRVHLPGLHVGLSGVAWLLTRLGRVERGQEALRRAQRHPLLYASMGLQAGASGYGMANLMMWHATGDMTFLEEARTVGQVLVGQARHDEHGVFWPDEHGVVHVGYGRGSSGVALFLLYLSLATGDRAFLDVGRSALGFDLVQGRTFGDGAALGFPSGLGGGGSLYPYLLQGSAGVGTVALRYHHVTRDPELRPVLDAIREAVNHKYSVTPGLFNGLAGLGNYALDAHHFLGEPDDLRLAHKVASGLLLFQVPRPNGIGFPGDHLHRLSTDFATGSAGVALFLHRLRYGAADFNLHLDELLETVSGHPPVTA
jgi:hypothetical protein